MNQSSQQSRVNKAALPRRIPGASVGTVNGINGIPSQNFSQNDDISEPPDIAELAAAWCTAQFVAGHTVTALDGYMAGFKACEDIYEGRA
jgi:hypothetical protein